MVVLCKKAGGGLVVTHRYDGEEEYSEPLNVWREECRHLQCDIEMKVFGLPISTLERGIHMM